MVKLLTTREVAEGLRISEEHTRELIHVGKIVAYKEGRRGGYRIPETEIIRYIENKEKEKN